MKTSVLTACVAATILVATYGRAEDARDASLYVGVKSCKMCHKGEAKGDQFGKWEAGPHAKAYTMLAGEAAKGTDAMRRAAH